MTPEKRLERLINALEPRVQKAFLESFADIKSEAQFRLIVRAIEQRDMNKVLELLALERQFFAPLDAALQDAFRLGGEQAMSDLMAIAKAQGAIVRGRFDSLNHRARETVLTNSSGLIVDITERQRELVRAALAESFDKNQSPQTTALDLVGRMNRSTGKREGGIVGLTNMERETRDKALAELLSGDPSQMRNYLRRQSRNKTFDGLVKRAIRDGKPVPATEARKIINKMESKMLKRRGRRIARTELKKAINSANHEAIEQLIESGQINRRNVINTWDASEDSATRPSHAAMDGQQKVQGQPFISGNGYELRYPGDGQRAPASEVINCRCVLRRSIDFIGQFAQDNGLVDRDPGRRRPVREIGPPQPSVI